MLRDRIGAVDADVLLDLAQSCSDVVHCGQYSSQQQRRLFLNGDNLLHAWPVPFLGLFRRCGSDQPLFGIEHEVGERLALTDRCHPLEVDETLLRFELDVLGAAYLTEVKAHQLLVLLLELLYVGVLVDVEIGTSAR